MNHKLRLAALAVCFTLAGLFLVPTARADAATQEMIVTVKKGPIELPGRVLAPGKYDMKFVEPEHVVLEITHADGSRPIGLFEVVPISRLHRTAKARVDVSEAAQGSISRLSDFFYPDAKTGYKFEYPRPETQQMAVKELKSRS